MTTKSYTITRYQTVESGLQPVFTSVNNYSFSVFRSRTGVPNPNWKRDIKAGVNASTAFTATAELLKIKPIHWELKFLLANGDLRTARVRNMLYNESYPTIISTPTPNVNDRVVEANAKAVKALYRKIRKVHSQFAGGVFLGEIMKTARMIARPAQALRTQISAYSKKAQALRKGPRGTSMDTASRKALSGLYLEAVFGWQPLLHDIRDGAVALARLVKDATPERFRAFGVDEKILSTTEGVALFAGLFNYGFKVVEKESAIVVYYGALRRTTMDYLGQASTQRIIDLSGFGLRDFIPTVWELIPYSFLVDYFTNIGDLLEAATTDTSNVSRLTKVTITETTRVVSVVNLKDINKAYWITAGRTLISHTDSPGGHEVTYRAVKREQTSVPFMVPAFERPDLLSKKSLNILALIAAR